MTPTTTDLEVLTAIGARSVEGMRGCVQLFDAAGARAPGAGGVSPTTGPPATRPLGEPRERRPAALQAVTRFLFYDLFKPVPLTGASDAIRSALGAPQPSASYVNAHTGLLGLGSLYGRLAVSGDLHRQLLFAARSPWDPAKLATAPRGGLLYVEHVVHGPGAPLDEAFFLALPPHLRRRYVDGSAQLLRVPLLADARLGASASTAGLHVALVNRHNQLVDHVTRAEGWHADRIGVFERIRRQMVTAAGTFVVRHVLPALCDPAILAWVQDEGRDTLWHRPRLGGPAEAFAAFSVLLGMGAPRAVSERLLSTALLMAPDPVSPVVADTASAILAGLGLRLDDAAQAYSLPAYFVEEVREGRTLGPLGSLCLLDFFQRMPGLFVGGDLEPVAEDETVSFGSGFIESCRLRLE